MKTKPPPYHHLFFDLDHTLWDFGQNSKSALQETFAVLNLEPMIFEVFYDTYNRHNDRLWELYRRNGITKQELSGMRFDLTLRDLNITGIDGMEFNDEYLRRMPNQTRLCPGAREILAELSGRFTLHIITNGFREVQYKKLATSGLDRFFSRVFLSEEMKVSKPDPEFFRYALKACRARKAESLVIGDSWEVDIAGAMEAGIDQVHYEPHGSGNQTHGATGLIQEGRTRTWRIRKLEELTTIVNRSRGPGGSPATT